jgi:NAD(P)-dependent dehydrogenase (short-subunit alcohol dehydrogenase family)
MAKIERGAIVNILDAMLVAPDAAPNGNYKSYGKSKIFLAEMTRNMAKSFAPQVRVNGVAPGFVLPAAGQSDDEFRKISGGKIVPPEQVAMAVRQLIESPAVSGEIVVVT